ARPVAAPSRCPLALRFARVTAANPWRSCSRRRWCVALAPCAGLSLSRPLAPSLLACDASPCATSAAAHGPPDDAPRAPPPGGGAAARPGAAFRTLPSTPSASLRPARPAGTNLDIRRSADADEHETPSPPHAQHLAALVTCGVRFGEQK